MATQMPTMQLRTSPHIKQALTVDVIMRNVAGALLPVAAFAVFQFGISALALLAATTLSCVLTEHLISRASGGSTVGDCSAVITGLLLGLTLPPGLPIWMAVVGGVIAIALGKALFGGLGYNVFNPALVGRAFLQAAFPIAVTTWTPGGAANRFIEFIPSTWTFPFALPADIAEWVQNLSVDAFSGATPLALMKYDGVRTEVSQLFFGMTAGSAGETSALVILICGAYLAWRKMMNWRIPVSMLASAALTGAVFYLANPERHPDPLFILCSGGLMLGAVFMASDMVASPVTPRGVWIYGALMGIVTVIIRLFGGLPEGVMYAILLGNAVSPIIENLTQPRVFGAVKKGKPPDGGRP